MSDVPLRVYSSSRFTNGNFLFPDRCRLETDRVVFEKRHLIGGEEESILYEQISSVSVNSGWFFADLLFETTGGSQPVFLNGLWKGSAARAKAELMARIRSHTSEAEDPVLVELQQQTVLLQQILSELRKSG